MVCGGSMHLKWFEPSSHIFTFMAVAAGSVVTVWFCMSTLTVC